MKHQRTALALLSLSTALACMAESVTLKNVVVEESATTGGITQSVAPNEILALQTYEEADIKAFAAQSNMSALKVINFSPSVSFNSVDIFGSNESSYHDPMRIRGKNQSGPGGVLTIEGLPMNGNPGGGKTSYDMENFSAIELYKGYMPVDMSLGFSNLIGKVDMKVQKPSDEFGVQASQMFGSHNTARTFMRVDSGKMGDVALFGSASYMMGDKWKGDGDLERTNGMLGVVYTPGDHLRGEFFAAYNDDKHYNYRQLTYEQAKDLDTHYRKDYENDSTQAAYSEYNKQRFKDTALFANLAHIFSNSASLSFQPYFLHDEGYYWFDTQPTVAGNTIVKRWDINHNLYGFVAKYEQPVAEWMLVKLGYWMHWQQPPGPPTNHKVYNVQGGKPTFVKYGILATTQEHEFNSPFLELSGEIGAFKYVAGIRYLNFRLAGIDSYLNATSPDYGAATREGTLDPYASVTSRYYTEWLPSLMLSCSPSRNLTLYGDYTRSYGYDVNLYPTYASKRQTFVDKGVALQQLWDKQRPEISDNYDLGLTYIAGNVTINPNLFMTQVTGKQVSAYDPEYDVVYPTNNADAKSYGAELTLSGNLNESLSFLVSGAFNRYYYTSDLRTSVTATNDISGNQIPDAPRLMANAAVTYRTMGWRFTPMVRYYSARYGDVDNEQKIGGCTLVDLDAEYTFHRLWKFKEAAFRLTATNLFDRKHISSIITPDNALAASTTSTTYQAGAPFGLYGGIALKF